MTLYRVTIDDKVQFFEDMSRAMEVVSVTEKTAKALQIPSPSIEIEAWHFDSQPVVLVL